MLLLFFSTKDRFFVFFVLKFFYKTYKIPSGERRDIMLTNFGRKPFFFKTLISYIVIAVSFSIFSLVIMQSLTVYGVNVLPMSNIREVAIQIEQFTNILSITVGINAVYMFSEVINLIGEYFEFIWRDGLKSNVIDSIDLSAKNVIEENRLDSCNSFLYSFKTEGLLE